MKASPMPCSAVLEPVNQKLKNAKGAALIYKVQLYPPSAARTNMSILAVHLPPPSSYGSYDGYEGFASKTGEISWRFKLYPTPEGESLNWAGRIDSISAEMINVKVQVRLSNSKTQKLGPGVLTNNVQSCY
ncbi:MULTISPECIES: hypothetical protein [Bacillus]|uniref:hypothetical protein n=1 Tax=Bacillus TaxID=1386 RepID=UPI00067BE5D3|nr:MULTISPECIES: hypothetical protein [Bacillus]KNX34131.1 hypothetical protein AFK74_09875 [Bacillus amyloliquefaciens]MCR4386994.1 hypothetical protein [Bacillus amyloliquefaciens]QLQ44206.1 hypothetical protein HZT45_09945 [Bacillus velezensis]